MNRNVTSHFSNVPSVGISRSKFYRPQEIKTSFNVGEIIPFYVDEVLPGDTHNIKTSKVVRLQTPITPFMDNIYLDTYYFFVPNRLVWEHWKEFCGENTQSAWIPQATYTIPQLVAPSSTGWNAGTIADYMGVPTGIPGLSVNALPFRAYALVMSEWFRNENLSDPLVIPNNDSTVTGVNTDTFVSDVAKGGKPYTANKYADYFTNALPAPQKGPDVTVSLVQSGTFPVTGNGKSLGLYQGGTPGFTLGVSNSYNTKFINAYGSDVGSSGTNISAGEKSVGVPTLTDLGDHPEYSGLVANLPTNVSIATVNQLRQAFQMQKFYEQQARMGSRYVEILKGMFDVNCPDYRLQRPEYLGGNRVPIVVNQVIQSSQTATTPQGTPAAYSVTTDVHGDFSKSFTEHGFIIGVMVARYDHTYQQGLERMWSRSTKFDYYWPVFANLGEQAIKNKEIYAQGPSVVDSDGNVIDEQVFGYQEAWSEYRYKPNRVSGEMRSTYSAPLDKWHLGDKYTALPSLSDSWIREDKSNVDRVLQVTSSSSNQLFGDIYIQNETVRPMPVYSVPGLIDHH